MYTFWEVQFPETESFMLEISSQFRIPENQALRVGQNQL